MQYDITFDYLCPFARNANEAVIEGLRQGRDWDVTFRPFSLAQVHVDEGGADVFDDPSASGVLALQWGIAVRDNAPDLFGAAHVALFAARHDHGLDIKDEAVIREQMGRRPWDVAVSPDGTKVYSSNGLSDSVSVIDAACLCVVDEIAVGRGPHSIAIGTVPDDE